MVIRALAFVAAMALTGAASAAPTVRSMYTSAFAREAAVRPSLASGAASAKTLKAARAVVAAYQAVVRRYPASSYCDNALWQAAHLALDTFARSGEARDRDTAVRLLHALASEYPGSKLAKQVPDQMERLAKIDAPDPVAAPGRPTPASASASASASSAPARIATITDIRRAVLPEAVRITIELDGEVPFRDEQIDGPARVFVDLSSTRAAPSLVDQTLRFDGDADLVHQVRIGRHPNNTTRVVLDVAGVSSYSVYPLYSPYRLVIDCVRAKGAKPEAPAAAVETTPTPAVLPAFEPSPLTAPGSAPAKLLPGGYSIARQLGLGVSRIVIDPGHGGHDPGALGKNVTEAALVLDVALRLEKLLAAVPGVDVILTRRTDEFVPLEERTAIANREGADLFLSIHANASRNTRARGIETYFLNFANDLSAAQVAARENAASGQAMGALPDLVKTIALTNKLDESRDFATQVQRAMTSKLRPRNKAIRDLGVKQAPFVVLIGAAMPSVLAEISFVTNPQDAKLLRSGAYRQQIAEALYGAVRTYQTSLKHVTAVASGR